MLYRLKRAPNIIALLLDLETVQNKRCYMYSGGNRRKLCAVMALIGDPAVVLLDAPTDYVDPIARRKLFNVINDAKANGQTLLYSSHR